MDCDNDFGTRLNEAGVLLESVRQVESAITIDTALKKRRKANRMGLHSLIRGCCFHGTEGLEAISRWAQLCIANEGGHEAVQKSIDGSEFCHATNRYIDARIDASLYCAEPITSSLMVPPLDQLSPDFQALILGRATDILRAARFSGVLDFLNVGFWFNDEICTVQHLLRTRQIDLDLRLPTPKTQVPPHALDKMLVMPCNEQADGYTGLMPTKPSAMVMAIHTAYERANAIARDAYLTEYPGGSTGKSGDASSLTLAMPAFVAYINNATNGGALLNSIAGTSVYPLVLPWNGRRKGLGSDMYHEITLLRRLHSSGFEGGVEILLRRHLGSIIKTLRTALYAAQKNQGIQTTDSPRLNADLHDTLYTAGSGLGSDLREIMSRILTPDRLLAWLKKDYPQSSLDYSSDELYRIQDALQACVKYNADHAPIISAVLSKLIHETPKATTALKAEHLEVYVEGIVDGLHFNGEEHGRPKEINQKIRVRSQDEKPPATSGDCLEIRFTADDCDLHGNGLSAGILSMTSVFGLLHNTLQRQSGLFQDGMLFLPIFHYVKPQFSQREHTDRTLHNHTSDGWTHFPLFRTRVYPFSTATPQMHGTANKPIPLETVMRGRVELTILVRGQDSLYLGENELAAIHARFAGARLAGGVISRVSVQLRDLPGHESKAAKPLPRGHVLCSVEGYLGESDWLTKMFLSNMRSQRRGGVPAQAVRSLPMVKTLLNDLSLPFGFTQVGYKTVAQIDPITRPYKGLSMPYRWALSLYKPVSYRSVRFLERYEHPLPWVCVEQQDSTSFSLTFNDI